MLWRSISCPTALWINHINIVPKTTISVYTSHFRTSYINEFIICIFIFYVTFSGKFHTKSICLQLHACTPTNMACAWRICLTSLNGDISVPVLPSLVFDCKVLLMPNLDLPYRKTIRYCMLSFIFCNYQAAKTYGIFDRLVSFVRKGSSSKKWLNTLYTLTTE